MSESGVADHPQRFPLSNPPRLPKPPPPRRTAPFDFEPGYYEPADLWLYGNVKLLKAQFGYVAQCLEPDYPTAAELDLIERQAEAIVLEGKVLVSGIHNPAHQRAAVVPLRWGAPRILVLSGGFAYHLGSDLREEPFRAARLWRYKWDPQTDLAISRRAPEKAPTFALYNPTVDRMIRRVAERRCNGLLFEGVPELKYPDRT